MPLKFDPILPTEIKEYRGIVKIVEQTVPLKKKGTSYVGDCPDCAGKGKLSVSEAKQIVKCFKCSDKGMDVVAWYMHIHRCEWADAVVALGKEFGMGHRITETDEQPAPAPQKPANAAKKAAKAAAKVAAEATALRVDRLGKGGTFCDRWLAERGITTEMQRGTMRHDKGENPAFDRYVAGTIDHGQKWEVVVGNDRPDVVMRYLGLDMRPMQYTPPKGRTTRDMVRVRFQNPEFHIVKGKPTKYMSPFGSGMHLWLPNRLIADYNRKAALAAPILTIQEGEAKADRVCQVVPTVGIIGIHGIARVDDALPHEFQQIIDRFDTQTVIYFLDADLFDIGSSADNSVDHRPRLFAKAVQRYRQHFHKFQGSGRRLNILLAHPNTMGTVHNGVDVKGMDDLLASGLMNDEELREAIAAGVSGVNHPLLTFYDLTTRTDAEIDKMWHLTGGLQMFWEAYGPKIKVKHPEGFRYGRLRYVYDGNGYALDSPMLPEEEFYSVTRDKDSGDPKKVNFSNVQLLNFMHNRGFFRFREPNGEYSYIRVEDKLVQKLPTFDLRDYVNEFLAQHETNNMMVRNHFLHNYEQFLSERTFSSLRYEEPLLIKDERHRKYFVFQNEVWNVSVEGVKVHQRIDLPGAIWHNSRIPESPQYVGPMYHLTEITSEMATTAKNPELRKLYAENVGRHLVDFTEEGGKCVFIRFLQNTSNFYWEKTEMVELERMAELEAKHPNATEDELSAMLDDMEAKHPILSLEEKFEIQQHFLAKITAIGHLLRKYRSPDADYGINAMEGTMVEDMRSEGRSGKSLIPKMLAHVVPVVNVDGKKDIDRDIYVFDKVTPQTALVNLDDISRKFDPVSLYSRMTGEFGVRAMNRGEVQIPYADAPLFYMSSNHNALGSDGSTRDRWRTIAFSDFYSAERKPQDIHGHLFYDEWDDAEKSRFFSLLAECCITYFTLGGVQQAPSDRIERRRWKQELGQTFDTWCEMTFKVPSKNDNVALRTGIRVSKLEALGLEGNADWSFYAKNPDQRKYMKKDAFKRKLWLWALLNDYEINPGLPCKLKSMPEFRDKNMGGDDKHMGTEYFTIVERGQSITPGIYGKGTPTEDAPY